MMRVVYSYSSTGPLALARRAALLLRPLALRWVRLRRFGGGGREVGHAPLGRCRRCAGAVTQSRPRARRRVAFTLVEPASDGAAGAAAPALLTGDGDVAFTATGTGAVACTLLSSFNCSWCALQATSMAAGAERDRSSCRLPVFCAEEALRVVLPHLAAAAS